MLLMLAQINYSYHCTAPSQTSYETHYMNIVTCCCILTWFYPAVLSYY